MNWFLEHLCLVASCSGLTTGFSGTINPHPNSSELSPQSLIPSHRHQYGKQLALSHLNIQSKHEPLLVKIGGSVVDRGSNLEWPIDLQLISSNESTSLQSFSPSQTCRKKYLFWKQLRKYLVPIYSCYNIKKLQSVTRLYKSKINFVVLCQNTQLSFCVGSYCSKVDHSSHGQFYYCRKETRLYIASRHVTYLFSPSATTPILYSKT